MKRRTLTNKDKEEIGLQCCNCGSKEDLQYHHIIPIVIGGKDINSNMCCLCYDCHYKLHHDGKEKKVNNYGELIKKGQARAKKRGILTGRIPNKIKIIMSDESIVIDTTRNIADMLNISIRTLEYWLSHGLTDRVKKKRNIKSIVLYEINHSGTKIA